MINCGNLQCSRNINKMELKKLANITNQSLARLSKNENVSLMILDRLCTSLECDLNDIIEYVPVDNCGTSFNINDLRMSLNTISLFSGAGGLDLGLINAGFNIVFANDNFKPAAENYRYNIGEISEDDILNIHADDLPEADVVVGGFPCQPFSNAGNRLGTDDERGNLYLEILRILLLKT